MEHARRLWYLDAMGIQTYVRRGVSVDSEKGGDGDSPLFSSPLGAEQLAPDDEKRGQSPLSPSWNELQQQVTACRQCPELVANRGRTVFGVGNREADWLIVGEAPGADEDRQGEPFVGRAGQLLNAMLAAAGLRREAVYIANILKCRPPDNRDPKAEEAAACESFLLRQIELIQPKIMLSVGRISAQNLLRTDTPVGRLRGRVHSFGETGIPLVVTYHPAYLLRSPDQKAKAWDDLQLALRTFRQ